MQNLDSKKDIKVGGHNRRGTILEKRSQQEERESKERVKG
jgi:hypothetical protein